MTDSRISALPCNRYQGGIDTELSYPYHAKDGAKCEWSGAAVATQVKGVVNITQYDEDELKVSV
jgi:hypothetical protein